MSNQHVQNLPAGMALVRAAPYRAIAGARLQAAARRLWRVLEHHGRLRSAPELLAVAERWQASNPTLARQIRSYVRGGSSY